MADAFTVDPEALADAVQRMGDYVRHTESIVSEIDTMVRQLHEVWSGQAAAAHADAHRLWTHGEATMRAALHQLQTAAHAAHHNYTQAIAANSTMWS